MILLIDNYDSFTWNLYHLVAGLGVEVEVVRNDAIGVGQAISMNPSAIVLSPGPCTPNEAGICLDLVAAAAGKIPVFGVCLGHQSIGQAFGGTVVRADSLFHGKTSEIHHNGTGLFAGIPSPFTATRYHSLTLRESDLPEDFEITAWTQARDGSRIIMGLSHKTLPAHGVQFHPESIASEHGVRLMENFLKAANVPLAA